MNNPLLNSDITRHRIDFSVLTPEHFSQAIQTLIPLVRQEHEVSVSSAPCTFEALFETDAMSRQLSRVLRILGHLNSVTETPALRAVYSNHMPEVSALYHEIGLDARAYVRAQALLESEVAGALTPLQLQAVAQVVTSYEREGIHLDAPSKDRMTEIGAKMSELAQRFKCNLTDFTDEASLAFTRSELAGVPERTLKNATLEEDGRFRLTMVSGGFRDISTYCEVDSTRKAVYDLQLERGVAQGKDNRPVLAEIIKLRQEHATLLGYANHAEYQLEENMAKRPDAALDFSLDLARRSLPQAKREMAEMLEFGSNLLKRIPEFHDIGFVSEKMREAKFSVNSEALRQYFPVEKVVGGLFELIETLYGLRFVANLTASTWHEDVRVYDVMDVASNVLKGTLYLDLFKRKHKNSGAWMSPVQSRHDGGSQARLPVTYIVCNAPKDVGQVATFDFDEVVTLFHEMGHGLHNLLTEVPEEYFSGLNQVEHDAVELPSQFMENFCWDYEILKKLTQHVVTGESLPVAEFVNLKASKLFMAANSLLAGARYSILDMMVYSNPDKDPFELETQVLNSLKTRERDPRATILPSFSHIFAGGYSAGYYAYQWAEMLSADAFAALKEEGSSFEAQRKAATLFRKHVLATGGVQGMDKNFKEFRGREPDLSHMLREYGMV